LRLLRFFAAIKSEDSVSLAPFDDLFTDLRSLS